MVFAITSDIAKRTMSRLIEKLPTFASVKMTSGNSIELNGNLVMFKHWEYRHSTGYKYQKWDKEFQDNSIDDSYAIKRIQFLENELIPPEPRRRTLSGHLKINL